MAKYKNCRFELVDVLRLAEMATKLNDQVMADRLRLRVEKSITESPEQNSVYIADILGKAKRKGTEVE